MPHVFLGDDDDDPDPDLGSASKRRRTGKSSKVKKSTMNRFTDWYPILCDFRCTTCSHLISLFRRISGAVNTALQKLCTILGLLKDLLLVERLSDSCILQLLKTSITTFLVENIQLLQLKAISLIGGVRICTFSTSLLCFLFKDYCLHVSNDI